jgi:hypothetical protein
MVGGAGLMKTINIAEDYSLTPLGRYPTDGQYSGERFREKFLKDALAADSEVPVDIDGTEGYGSSFVEEAFGGLILKGYFTADQLKSRLPVASKDPEFGIYRDAIWKYIGEAKMEG